MLMGFSRARETFWRRELERWVWRGSVLLENCEGQMVAGRSFQLWKRASLRDLKAQYDSMTVHRPALPTAVMVCTFQGHVARKWHTQVAPSGCRTCLCPYQDAYWAKSLAVALSLFNRVLYFCVPKQGEHPQVLNKPLRITRSHSSVMKLQRTHTCEDIPWCIATHINYQLPHIPSHT